jgi:serine/threonine-protein kinase
VDAAADLGPGTKIDRYEIVRSVASGGMGHVWLGRLSGKHGFEKLVAIKTIRPDLVADARLRTMLLDEVRICSRIQHANVAQILDVGEHGTLPTLPYVVFEWVDGATLAELFLAAERGGGRAAVAPLLRVVAGICEGLHAAHELTDEQGRSLQVVHRDVSPGNIIVGRSGFAKLIDFGVARARDRIAGDTRSGIVKGTPQYMAPEQAQGVKVDRRADIWAIGGVLHRGLSGAPPFEDRFALEEYICGRSGPAPLPDSVPEAVRAIVERAMRRDPAERFASAADLGFALEQVLRASDARPNIADLFPPDEAARAPAPSELTTRPEDLALAQTSVADLPRAERTPTAVEGRATRRRRSRPTPWLMTAFAVAAVGAVLGIGALVWALLSP